VAVYPQLVNDWQLIVNIFADSEGLTYLAKLFTFLADIQQEEEGVPRGERAHVELFSGEDVDGGSADLCIWRADASGDGKLPDFMEGN